MRTKLTFGLCVLSLTSACATVLPALTRLAVAIGQDLIATASDNYTPRYGYEVENLLASVMRETTGLNVVSREERIATSNGSGGYQAAQGAYRQGQDTYQEPQYTYDEQQPTYEQTDDTGYSAAAGGVEFAFGVWKQSGPNGGEFEEINDGDTLFDGGTDPQRGDKFKATIETNCDCYVYVIGIDATGFVAQVFPDPDGTVRNPVIAYEQYVMPEGAEWWGLDQNKGVEHLFVVVSETQRTDIEGSLNSLAAEHTVSRGLRAVKEPVVPPARRGLVKVADEQVQVRSGQKTVSANVDRFRATVADADAFVVRWFNHE